MQAPVSRAWWFALAVASGVTTTGCLVGDPTASAPGPAVPSWDEFRRATYRGTDGIFVVDGDIAIADEKQLRAFWELLATPRPASTSAAALIVNTRDGAVDRWPDARKRALTYCVSPAFGVHRDAVLAALREAAELGWERFADVDFVHVAAEDAACGADNDRVEFDVRPVDAEGNYLARAFFPSDPRSRRELLIDGQAFTAEGAWPLPNVLAHELGHVLGFRHEHTRPEAASCFEDDAWAPVTTYDPGSVMHYPDCNGRAPTLSFTLLDRDGAAKLYGAPGTTPPFVPVGGEQRHGWSGSLAAGEARVLSPTIVAAPGSTVRVAMTGTGDPDLYVRFGAAPSRVAYDCRPFTEGAAEGCELTVPADHPTVHIGVVGYERLAASTFAIEVTYVAP